MLIYGVDQGAGALGIVANVDALFIGESQTYWAYGFAASGRAEAVSRERSQEQA